MNLQIQLLIKVELERLLNAGYIKPVDITDWVSPMVLVKNKNGKLRVCVDYEPRGFSKRMLVVESVVALLFHCIHLNFTIRRTSLCGHQFHNPRVDRQEEIM